MNFIMAIIDALAGFVQRNPLTTLLIVILALCAPALLKGIALFVLYLLMGIVIFVLVLVLLLRWRVLKVRRQMEEQFGQGFGTDPRGGFDPRQGTSPFGEDRSRTREGEVHVHRTAGTPEKRVSKDVGDYVDFEEEKER